MYFVETQDNLRLYLKTYHASTCCIKCSYYNVYMYYVFNICILRHTCYLQNEVFFLRIKRARKNVMTNRLVCSLKVKKITFRQCGWFIKKKFSTGRYAGNIDTFFGLRWMSEKQHS